MPYVNFMDKAFLKQCIDQEVDHWARTKNTSFCHKIWFRHFQAESNAVYLVRQYQYHISNGGYYHKIRSRFLEMRMMRRYGIFIGRECEIDIGFRIWHPHGIIINNAKIGKNFNVNQNTTVGAKVHGSWTLPTIGDNVTMYANSTILGDVHVEDNVVLGAHALLLESTTGSGSYVGVPAKRVEKKA